MKKGLSELVLIIDKSGSMYSIINDAIGGYNSYIEEQKKLEGEAKVTTVLFNHEYNIINENIDITKVDLLDKNTYIPSGMTSLLHAVGKTIDDVGKRLSNTPEEQRPEHVILSILTDGQENSSHNCTPSYTRSKIKEMIEHQKKNYKWEFVFLGANQDAFAEANSIGISNVDTVSFRGTGEGVRGAYTSMSKLSMSKRV